VPEQPHRQHREARRQVDVQSRGFAAVARADARVLVLGSLPGQVSLRERQYYAQPRNDFWKIMGALAGASPDLAYADRLAALKAQRIALWDVCASARRPGSLDSSIRYASVVTNDFAAFLRSHRRIRLICFNGRKAADLYRRLVLPGLPGPMQAIRCETLPSTSPAHAAMRFEEKLAWWSIVRGDRPRK
jgi:hypoxanthine-DNA glycosylase